jgi:hypothetical protein
MCSHHQDVSGMRVRRPRLGVQVVTVVPDPDQTEVGHGGVRRRSGPGDDPDL